MSKFAFTFGLAYDLHDKFIVVEAEDRATARALFVAARAVAGNVEDSAHRWSFQYPVDEKWAETAERFELTEVPLDTPINWRDD